MKKLTISIILVLFSINVATAQNFASPECIRWDPVNSHYLVSNVAGYILSVDPETLDRTEFANDGLRGPKGMVVVGDVVYVTDLTEVEGFSLVDGSQVFHLAVTGSAFLNGITADKDGILYAADTDKGTVFKIDPATATASVLASSNLTGINGVFYDEENNRLIAVLWKTNAPVTSVSLADGSVTVLLETTYSNLDGITRDNCGNYYFSSWGTNTVYVTSNDFADAPTAFYTGLSGPADIFFDEITQELWVPKFNANAIVRKQVFLPCVAPQLVSPENGSTEQASRNLELSWSGVPHAKSYKIEVSLSPTFESVLLALGAGEPSVTIEELDLNKEYFWRVAATDGSVYSDYSQEFSFTTEESSSTNNLVIDLKLSSYPNPVSEQLTITADHPDQQLDLKIVNLSGQQLKEFRHSHQTRVQVDVSGWPTGGYMLLWETSKGQHGSKKFIVR